MIIDIGILLFKLKFKEIFRYLCNTPLNTVLTDIRSKYCLKLFDAFLYLF